MGKMIMNEKKSLDKMKRKFKQTVLIILLLLWISLILYLSFQTGTNTANTSMEVTKCILKLFLGEDIPQDVLFRWHMTFRLWAHPIIFCFFSVLAMGVAFSYIEKRGTCVLFAALSGVMLAVFTEVGKWNIPGRHCDIKEMGLNVIGVLVGIILMFVVQLVSKKTNRGKECI